MVDSEVEETLREIRERVRAGTQTQTPAATQTGEAVVVSPGTAAMDAATTPHAAADARARLEANLATIERTWNRLPPLMSYRRGWAARLELWIKRVVKRATHWYTWEQVNFNAATHAALRDTLAALSAYEQHLQNLSAQLQSATAETDARLAASESRWASDEAQLRNSLAALAEELRHEVAAMRNEQRATTDALRHEQRAATDALRSEQRADREMLLNEERERVEHLTEEQRVCFKQLSLEVSEAAVASDRARRHTEQRLDELAQRLEQALKTVMGDK